MSDFKDGDVVTVHMARNDVFEWQRSPRFQAYFRRGPRGDGDCFLLDVAQHNETILLNGNSADFVAIVKDDA